MRGCIACSRVARVRVGRVEVICAWAGKHVPQPSTKIDANVIRRVIKLIEDSDEPRPGAVVGRVVVVDFGVSEGGVALRTIAAARRAARVLDGEHAYARLDAVAQEAARAVDLVVIDELIKLAEPA